MLSDFKLRLEKAIGTNLTEEVKDSKKEIVDKKKTAKVDAKTKEVTKKTTPKVASSKPVKEVKTLKTAK